jgi:alkanesulfonate monooxygenase SsuD/methylene tetrahydromethanopterin reductase-like flavin-dependent oxidoreductase (luciferase family)
MTIEFGIASLTDHVQKTADGRTVNALQRVQQLIDLGVRADELRLDNFAIGEHHTPDFAVSSPAVLLAAVGAKTDSITLGTAVTVLSALDPVRVFEDFATLDQTSSGRAEITVGRGAFVEPFTIFGVPLEEYDLVFQEKLELLLRLREEGTITWQGRFRSPLAGAEIAPRTVQDVLPVWIGVGGSPESAARAGRLGLPMILGSLGLPMAQVKTLADIYREAGYRAGRADRLRLGFGAHFFAGGSEAEARSVYPFYRDFLGPKRPGRNGITVTQAHFDAGFAPDSTRYIGTTNEIIDKLGALYELVKFDRFQALLDWGGLPTALVDDSLNRLATEVTPALRGR